MKKYVALFVVLAVVLPLNIFGGRSSFKKQREKWLLSSWDSGTIKRTKKTTYNKTVVPKRSVQVVQKKVVESVSPVRIISKSERFVDHKQQVQEVRKIEKPAQVMAYKKQVQKVEKPVQVVANDQQPQDAKKHVEIKEAHPFSLSTKTLGHDLAVTGIGAKEKDSFRVDLSITSTKPVNVAMNKDRLVVEQVDINDNYGPSTYVASGKVISVDMKNLEEGKKRSHNRKNRQPKEQQPVYKVPSWPLCAEPFDDKDKIEINMRYQNAGNSFSSGGHTQDITKLVFGEPAMYVRDILLVSKLVEQNQVLDYSSGNGLGTGGYLGEAAKQLLCFDGSIDDFQISFGYVRHFMDNDISLGLELPFHIRKHNLKLTTTSCSLMRYNEAFQAKYGDCFKEFVKDILCNKNSVLTEGDTEAGIGDISVFVNFELKSRHFERMLLGAKVLFPTAKERNVHKLWDPELGNGGFTELTAFGAILFATNAYFNPHAFVQVVYCLPADATRRISSWKQYTEPAGGAIHELGNLLAMGELVRTIPGTTDFTMLDATFRRFSTETQRVRMRKGAEINLRVGNMFEKFISDRGFFDIFYDIRLKDRDYINTRNLDCSFYPEILKQNTYQVEHRFGANFSYQFDNHVRAMLGGMYSFAGHNVPKTIEFNGALSVEF